MKSRSYFVSAIGSFLLLAACNPIPTDGGKVSKADEKADVKADEKKADVKVDIKAGDSGDVLLGGDSGEVSTSGYPAMADDGGASEYETDGANDGCGRGEMVFEGSCVSKQRVSEILEERETQAVAKVKTAKRPQEQAQAATELIEQQMYQIDKHADDFDEIIEQLKQEKLEKEAIDNDEKPD